MNDNVLEKRISDVENELFQIKLALIQICIDINWRDDEIKNVICATDDMIKNFRDMCAGGNDEKNE